MRALLMTAKKKGGTVLFDFGDWSNSQWTAIGGNQGTITKTSSSISFYRSGYSNNYLSEYGIDGTKDFLLEINANIPNTTNATHRLGLYNPDTDGQVAGFMTSWNSTDRNKICCQTDYSTTFYREANPGTADYFIKKEGNTLTMGRGGVTKCTVNNHTFPASFYLFENVYNNTLTIYTAKLTYLSSSNVQNLQSIQNNLPTITPTITPSINLNDINTNSSGSGNIQSI